MHEASVVANIVDAVLEELKKYDVRKVNSVTLRIGDLTQLGEEQMKFAYEILSEGNLLSGSELIIEPEPVVLRCHKCGYEGRARTLDSGDYAGHQVPVLSCPECGGEVEVIEGQSCCVKCMDIETGDE
ncbi:MAG: hydrogenase/urease maturation nickel metallochaperone HypA [archaeon]|nr:hydrogenase/urease maturation nickel metallochaperone HypA [archaeon]